MLNQPIENFTAQATSEKTVQLADLAGKNCSVVFLPERQHPRLHH